MTKPIWKEILEEDGVKDALLYKPKKISKKKYKNYTCSVCGKEVRDKKRKKNKFYTCKDCRKPKGGNQFPYGNRFNK